MEVYLKKKVIIDENVSKYCYTCKFKNKFYILYPTDINQPSIPTFDIIPFKTPIIWLDVDGVINIFRRTLQKSKIEHLPSDVKEISILHGYGLSRMNNILYSPAVIERINKWSTVAEVRFMTSWGDMATYRLSPAIGLIPFPHNIIGKYKLMENLPPNEDLERPLIWIDDEINCKYSYVSKSYNILKPYFKNKILIIDTNDNENYTGLTEKQLDLVDDFLVKLRLNI